MPKWLISIFKAPTIISVCGLFTRAPCFIHNTADMMSLTHCLLSCPHLFVRHFLPFIIFKLNYRRTQMHRVPLLSQFLSLLFPAAFLALALGKSLVSSLYFSSMKYLNNHWIYLHYILFIYRWSYAESYWLLFFSASFPLSSKICQTFLVSLVGADIHGPLMTYLTEFGHSLTFPSINLTFAV